jgi:hypothetical protein
MQIDLKFRNIFYMKEEEYLKLIQKFVKVEHEYDDKEYAHIIQDEIYRKFINDIANNKLNSLKEVKLIAKIIKKHVIKYDKDRWYA